MHAHQQGVTGLSEHLFTITQCHAYTFKVMTSFCFIFNFYLFIYFFFFKMTLEFQWFQYE